MLSPFSRVIEASDTHHAPAAAPALTPEQALAATVEQPVAAAEPPKKKAVRIRKADAAQ
jgi:hypothetical protein